MIIRKIKDGLCIFVDGLETFFISTPLDFDENSPDKFQGNLHCGLKEDGVTKMFKYKHDKPMVAYPISQRQLLQY